MGYDAPQLTAYVLAQGRGRRDLRRETIVKARPSVEKRRKEQARQDRMKEKAEKREIRKTEKAQGRAASGDDEDPDLAGMVAGPQPLPPEFQ